MLGDTASDLGVSKASLSLWLKHADIEDGNKPGVTDAERSENRELRRKNKLLEQENEVLRRAAAYLSQANLPGNDVPARGSGRLAARHPSFGWVC